jgi:hypothetical protein
VRTISGLPRGFSTCCLRFTNGVATIHAKLASGWLAGLYREGVKPSGSRRKVSDFVLILLSWTFPDATKIGSSMSLSAPCTTRSGSQESRGYGPCRHPSVSPAAEPATVHTYVHICKLETLPAAYRM